jgi:hypothetical protein
MFLLNAKTHVDILGQELVGCLVLLQNVCVDAGAGKRAAEEEAEETIGRESQVSSIASTTQLVADGDD